MTPSDAAHSTNLYYILSLLTDAEALDIVQNSPESNGLEVWRRMVSRWEPKAPSRKERHEKQERPRERNETEGW